MQTTNREFGVLFVKAFGRAFHAFETCDVLLTAQEAPSESAEKESPEKEDGKDSERKDGVEATEGAGKNKDANEKPKKKPLYKRPVFIIVVSGVLFVALILIVLYWLYARHFVSTDDAYIDGHVVQVAPQVPGPVVALHVDDNQFVHKGDVLVELDATDYQVAEEQSEAQLAAARARLAQAQAQVESANAGVTQVVAEVTAAQVALDNATKDLKRYQAVDQRARSQEQLDNAVATQKTAQAQFEQVRAHKVSAQAAVDTAVASVKAAQGDVHTAEANLKRARVNLGYCRVYAPADGRVTQRSVEVGNYVQTGATMFMLVSPNVWVTANFKETQLKHMRPGQPATIKVDAYSGREFHGHVDSIQAGSGSRFGVLPPENATGNFVKIVQRVPVKIVFDFGSNTNDAGLLSPGLSVIPKVRVR